VIYPKPLDNVRESMDEAERYGKRASERTRIEIDVEDARDD
jgi:hypothetical protein